MYKSPIDIIMSEIKFDIAKQQEENIVKAVQEYGIDIDYDELIKALNYDRNQYNKGYEDGYKDGAIKNKEKAISKLKEIPSHYDDGNIRYGIEIAINVLENLPDEFEEEKRCVI